jgi:hypothetical protein
MYSFMDGYNDYNQVKMVKEDKDKMAFILEWGRLCLQRDAFWVV